MYKNNKVILYKGCSIKILPKIKYKISMVCTDPPYGISYEPWDVLHKNTNSSLLNYEKQKRERNGKPIRGWSKADLSIGNEYTNWVESWINSLYYVMKPAAVAAIFNSRRMNSFFLQSLPQEFLLQDILAYIKPSSYFQAFRPFPEDHPDIRIGNLSPKWEPILVLRKNFKGTNKENIKNTGCGGMNVEKWKKLTGDYSNIINGVKVKNKQHPTQKDIETCAALIETFCPPKGIVLDPFMDVGTTGIAALKTGRRFIGIEREKEFYQLAVNNIEDIK